MRVTYIWAGLLSALSLVGCKQSSSPRVILPSTPPLSAEVLEQTASTCQKELERLRSRSPYVPEERKKEYDAVMNLAEKDCSYIVDTLSRLKAATHKEQSLRQNLNHAEATMLPGTLVSEPDAKDDPLQKTSGDIAMEPLK